MADNFSVGPEGTETETHLYDLRRLRPDISLYNNAGPNQLMYSDRLADTFNSEWSSDSWLYRPVQQGSMPNTVSHVSQSHTSTSAGFLGPFPHTTSATSAVQPGNLPIYSIPTTSSIGSGSHLQSGIPPSSNYTGGAYLSNFNVSGPAPVPPHGPTVLFGEDPHHYVHLCDSSKFF